MAGVGREAGEGGYLGSKGSSTGGLQLGFLETWFNGSAGEAIMYVVLCVGELLSCKYLFVLSVLFRGGHFPVRYPR